MNEFVVPYKTERTVGPFSVCVSGKGDVTVTVTSKNGDVKTSPLLLGQTLRTEQSLLEMTGRSGSKGVCQFRLGQKRVVKRRKLVRRAAKQAREAR
jgi:hypothetical protein